MKLPIRTKFAYGVGQVAETVKTRGFDLLVFFYFTQVLGLSGTLAGVAVFIALIFDAVTDPFAGLLSDHWKSPRGRRHPFMYAAAMPLGVAWLLLFLPPDGLGQSGLFAWMLVFAILVRGAMTLYLVPYLALGAELSDDYHERTSVVAWRTALALLGTSLVFVVGIRFFFPETPEYANGMLNPSGYPHIALFSALVMSASVWYSAWGTRDRIPFLPQPADDERTSYLDDIRSAFRNHSFLALFVGFGLFAVSIGLHQTLTVHLNVFFWGFDTQKIAWLVLPLLIGFVPGVLIARPLHASIDKKATIIWSALASTVFMNAPIVLRLVGFFPENDSPALFPIVAVSLLLVAIAGGIAYTTAGSMMADVAQEHEFQTGRSQQGVLFSAISFTSKVSSGLGHLIAGVGLDVIGFPLGAAPASVSPLLVARLGEIFVAGSLTGVLGLGAYAFYRLDRARHEETRAKLEERRRQRLEAPDRAAG